MDYFAVITVEPKEDVTADGVSPSEPSEEELAARLTDVLADVTKHDSMTGWRVVRVRA